MISFTCGRLVGNRRFSRRLRLTSCFRHRVLRFLIYLLTYDDRTDTLVLSFIFFCIFRRPKRRATDLTDDSFRRDGTCSFDDVTVSGAVDGVDGEVVRRALTQPLDGERGRRGAGHPARLLPAVSGRRRTLLPQYDVASDLRSAVAVRSAPLQGDAVAGDANDLQHRRS